MSIRIVIHKNTYERKHTKKSKNKIKNYFYRTMKIKHKKNFTQEDEKYIKLEENWFNLEESYCN